jgi:hypothetical protein
MDIFLDEDRADSLVPEWKPSQYSVAKGGQSVPGPHTWPWESDRGGVVVAIGSLPAGIILRSTANDAVLYRREAGSLTELRHMLSLNSGYIKKAIGKRPVFTNSIGTYNLLKKHPVLTDAGIPFMADIVTEYKKLTGTAVTDLNDIYSRINSSPDLSGIDPEEQEYIKAIFSIVDLKIPEILPIPKPSLFPVARVFIHPDVRMKNRSA